MLIQSSLKISLRRPILPLVAGALLLLFVAGIKLDLTGFERRVPEAEEVERVSVYGLEFKEEANIEAALALHQSLIDNRARHECVRDGIALEIRYTLRDGRTLLRSYSLSYDDEDPDPELLAAAALLNSREALRSRVSTLLPVEPRYIAHAELCGQLPDADGWTNEYWTLYLSGEEAAALYREGILPDAEEEHIGCGSFAELLPDALTPSGYHVELILEDDPGHTGRERHDAVYDYHYIEVYEESAHTLAWIEKNIGF